MASTANVRPAPDRLLVELADYALGTQRFGDEALATARLCVLDSLGCALLALDHPSCTKLLGPLVPGSTVAYGCRVPGTDYELDPVKGAFDLGTLIRWLDFNDTWLAAEWGHPSDNLGAILALSDWQARCARAAGTPPPTMATVLDAAIRAHEIQGVLALTHAFNRVGLDHVLLVRIASTAVACRLLGLSRDQTVSALSHAWIDGCALRTYRHAPNTGSRKSWAAGDATSRGVRLALLAATGEMSCPSALTAPQWGFQDVLFRGQPVALAQPLGSYVMENVLFKIAFPAEFHAQTAVEAALQLHPLVHHRLDAIARIDLFTQEPAVRIIAKTGPLHNPADRDHCLQYMVAVALLHGSLTAAHYEDGAAADPRLDSLRHQMVVAEEPRYTRDYLDPAKRSIANAVQVHFTDGSSTPRLEVEYPLGHRRRRAEGVPLLRAKARTAIAPRFGTARAEKLVECCTDPAQLDPLPVDDFMAQWR
jgi:2-methylcitrate dehydratase